MPRRITLILLLSLLSLSFCVNAAAQRMFFNTTDAVYEIQGIPGSFTYKELGRLCVGTAGTIMSTAMYGDTLYILTPDGIIFRNVLATGSCELLTDLDIPGLYLLGINNLTCDKNGLLYCIADGQLVRYDPHQNTIDALGSVPVSPDGDLLFYNDQLLCAGDGPYIWSIDPNNPSNDKQLMSTGNYQFFGLLAMPDNCQRNRLFGIDAGGTIVEIDPTTWTLGNVVGLLPPGLTPYDAASTMEDGVIRGEAFDSLAVFSPCGTNTLGHIQAFASSAQDGGAAYTLDGTITNTTGIFANVSVGTHTLHIEADPTCGVDSVFTISQGLSYVDYTLTGPEDCTQPTDGKIQIDAGSQAIPILFSLNNGTPQVNPEFARLDTGEYTIKIVDAGHCEKDTTIDLGFQHILPFPAALQLSPALCDIKNGGFELTLNSGIDPATFSWTIDGSDHQTSPGFSRLGAGMHTLQVFYTGTCRFDSVITIPMQLDPAPSIQAAIRDQLCFTNNGQLTLAIAGPDGPYLNSLNGGALTAALTFDSLAPSTYQLDIQDQNGCHYDTAFVIRAYPREAVTLSIDSLNPVCTQLNSGSLTITVQGDQAPYWLEWGNATYANGSTITQLSRGNFALPILNKDGCIVDTAQARLNLIIEPECETVYLPNAFTPDHNGTNDVFRVLHSPYMTVSLLRVFNRYGGLVFTSSPQTPGWDGSFHGVLQPAGLYVWEVYYTDLENIARTQHGTVLLIR